jgi:RNA polymerase sigma-70 factor (ECF subfamily)
MEVIRRAQRGDERAFALIVHSYEAPIFNYVLRMVGSRTLAEDLTQDVFLRVFQGLRGYSRRARFTTWLFQVAKNRVVDEMRAVERRPKTVLAIEDAPRLEAVDAPIELSEAISTLWRAVEALSPDLKEALLLRDIAGLSYNEIADTLEVTLATVKWRIFKAREEVQQALEEQGVEIGRRREPKTAAAGRALAKAS